MQAEGACKAGASAEDGQALVEYSLLLALIAVVAFGAVNEFGLGVSSLYSQIVSGVKAGMP